MNSSLFKRLRMLGVNRMVKEVQLNMSSSKETYIPSQRLKGKVAVVTASTDGQVSNLNNELVPTIDKFIKQNTKITLGTYVLMGIGFAIAKRLGNEGAKVVISSRKEKNVSEAVKSLKNADIQVIGTVCHVSKSEDRNRLFKTAIDAFGGIDILVSNAAVNPTVGSVLDCPEEAWDKIFDVNVKAAFMLSKEVLPYLRQRKGGSIIYISSIAGFQPLDLLGAYSVSKTALLGLTKAAALDLAAENIRVNCLAPGIVQTRFSSALHESETAKEAALSMIPMKRLAQPDEMASVVAFLCSDDASYVTGETFIAAGGMASRL